MGLGEPGKPSKKTAVGERKLLGPCKDFRFNGVTRTGVVGMGCEESAWGTAVGPAVRLVGAVGAVGAVGVAAVLSAMVLPVVFSLLVGSTFLKIKLANT